jgi:amino acid transporter
VVGWFQPYVNCFGLFFVTIVVFLQGYSVFLPGNWDVGTFFTYYTMIFVCLLLFVGWKVVKRTRFVPAKMADLVWDKPVIDAYEEAIEPPLGVWQDIWESILARLHLRPKEHRRTSLAEMGIGR